MCLCVGELSVCVVVSLVCLCVCELSVSVW